MVGVDPLVVPRPADVVEVVVDAVAAGAGDLVLAGDRQAADLAAVMQNFADDLAARNDDARAVRVPECRVEQADVEHFAFLVADRDVIANVEGLREDDRQTGNDVAEYALQGQRDARAGDAEAGDQRQQFDPEVLHGHDDEQAEDEQLHQPCDQLAHWRFELEARQQARDHHAGPATGHIADQQDDPGNQQPGSELDAHVDGRRLHLVQCLQ